MDEQVAKLVGLIEHAELVQQTTIAAKRTLDAGVDKLTTAADAAKRTLNDASAQLDKRIADAVQKALEAQLKTLPADLKASLAESLSGPSGSIQAASDDLSRASARLGWKQAAVAAAAAFSMVLGCVLVWWWLVPSGAAMQQLRDEHAQLVADNDRLNRHGALSTCGPQGQPCARVDMSQSYGKHADYYVLKTQGD